MPIAVSVGEKNVTVAPHQVYFTITLEHKLRVFDDRNLRGILQPRKEEKIS
jgi:hypothetical protein